MAFATSPVLVAAGGSQNEDPLRLRTPFFERDNGRNEFATTQPTFIHVEERGWSWTPEEEGGYKIYGGTSVLYGPIEPLNNRISSSSSC